MASSTDHERSTLATTAATPAAAATKALAAAVNAGPANDQLSAKEFPPVCPDTAATIMNVSTAAKTQRTPTDTHPSRVVGDR